MKKKRKDPARGRSVYTIRDDGQWSLLVGRWPREEYAELKRVREKVREVLASVARDRARKGGR